MQNQQNSRFNVGLYGLVVVLRPGRPEVRILPVAPRAAPYGVLLFLFCTDFMEQQKRGIRTARAPRFASRGAETPQWELSVFRCLHDEPVPPATRQTPAGPPRCKDGWVECPRQTVNDFIGIRGSVCGLFLFVQTHAPLDICEQHTMCLISVSHIVMFAEKTYNAFEPVGHTKRRKERES